MTFQTLASSPVAAERMWFMDGLVRIHLARAANPAGASLIEHDLPHGFSPPVHVHHNEDETFFVLEGRFRFIAGGEAREAGPGELVHLAAAVPHSFLVLSAEGGRCLTLTHGGFETMVREASRPAPRDGRPNAEPPSSAAKAHLAEVCARHGITILGDPLARA